MKSYMVARKRSSGYEVIWDYIKDSKKDPLQRVLTNGDYAASYSVEYPAVEQMNRLAVKYPGEAFMVIQMEDAATMMKPKPEVKAETYLDRPATLADINRLEALIRGAKLP